MGGNGGKHGDSQVGIDLHLLAKGTARDETADKGGHTQPPVVLRQQGVSAKESSMARGEGRMDRSNKIMTSSRRDKKTVFEIQM